MTIKKKKTFLTPVAHIARARKKISATIQAVVSSPTTSNDEKIARLEAELSKVLLLISELRKLPNVIHAQEQSSRDALHAIKTNLEAIT